MRVCVRGEYDSATYPTKREAAAWAVEREAELRGRRLAPRTLREALVKYAAEVSPKHRGERWELVRLEKLGRDPIADRKLGELRREHLAGWRDRSLQALAPASVAREFSLLRSVLGMARREWGWMEHDPADGVRRPPGHAKRSRRVTDAEVAAIRLALGWPEDVPPVNASQRIAAAMVFSLETAMRSGEVCSLAWEQVDEGAAFARLTRTKNGDTRDVPLSTRALAVLALLPRAAALVFDLDGGTRDALFRRARKAAGVEGMTWHDLRHEATTRLALRLSVLDLARMTGHRDPRSLMTYYNPTASEIAKRLG